MRLVKCIPAFCLGVMLAASGCASVEGNKYNPYVHSRLPSVGMSQDGEAMTSAMGGKASSLQDEAKHRPRWKDEVYPVVFGNRKANNEILVFIDYASPESERVWAEVLKAIASLSPDTNKVVVLGKSSEHYGTELMGGGIWISYSRPKQSLAYYTYSLGRWNAVKAQLARKGIKRAFSYEYDATAQPTDQPILYSFFNKTTPVVPTKDQVDIVRYAFDAGNINMYQAVQASNDYGVKKFPAVVVNDVLLKQPTAQNIIKAADRP